MNKKVLIITPTFPPYQGSHTERMTAMANTMESCGFEVHVLTNEILSGNPSYNPSTMETIDKRIKIYRSPYGCLHRNAYKKKSFYTDIKYNGSNKDTINTKKIWKIKMVKTLEKLKKKVLIPDTLIDWYYPAVKFVKKNKLIQSIKPDYIISCSMPNSSHVISYKLSKKYNIPMIMDIADPWVYLSYYKRGKLAFFIERKMEARYLNHSKLICFSTIGAEKLYADKYDIPKEKLMTSVTGYNSSLLSTSKSMNSRKTTGIHMIYGGALQLGIRNPKPLLQGILSYQEKGLFFHIRTDNIDLIKNMINLDKSNILVEHYVPFEQFYQEMLCADVLVFFGNSTSDQLPGKIFNYIATGKLIFYISNTDEDKDQALGIVKDYGNYIIVKNNAESIDEGLRHLIETYDKGMLDVKPDMDKISKYSSYSQFKNLTERIMQL